MLKHDKQVSGLRSMTSFSVASIVSWLLEWQFEWLSEYKHWQWLEMIINYIEMREPIATFTTFTSSIIPLTKSWSYYSSWACRNLPLKNLPTYIILKCVIFVYRDMSLEPSKCAVLKAFKMIKKVEPRGVLEQPIK